MNVHQVLSSAGPVDAVTNQARAMRSLFDEWGWGGRDVAVWIDPRMDSSVRPLRTLAAEPRDVLLLHYSAYAPKLRDLLKAPNPKLLLSHNVTPAHWFWDYEPAVAVRCALGRRQLPAFAREVDIAAGVSQYNASELEQAGARETAVIPVIFDPRALGEPAAAASAPTRSGMPATVLFVGRLAPHKRQDELIRAFALYRNQRAPDARLVLVGEPLTPAYGRALADLAEQLAPAAVTIESGLSAAQLADRYRQADVFACLSEHEGFCIPLLEAFHFGVPVLARPVGGIPEVAQDGAILTDDEDLAVIAELLQLLVSDAELRSELRERGRARLAHYAPAKTAAQLRAVVEAVAARAPTPTR